MKLEEIQLKLVIDNFVISSLGGELIKNTSERIGFLLGSCTDIELADNISDEMTGSEKKKIRRTLSVESFKLVEPENCFFEFNSSKVDVKKVKKHIKESKGKLLLGWFCYRPFSCHSISLREISVHHQLTQMIPEIQRKVPLHSNHFLYMLFTIHDLHPLFSLRYGVYKLSSKTNESYGDEYFGDIDNIKIEIGSSGSIPYETQTQGTQIGGLEPIASKVFYQHFEKLVQKEIEEMKKLGNQYEEITNEIRKKEVIIEDFRRKISQVQHVEDEKKLNDF